MYEAFIIGLMIIFFALLGGLIFEALSDTFEEEK